MAAKNKKSNLRRELEVLRNQANAYGLIEKKTEKLPEEDKESKPEPHQFEEYSYVKKDLVKSLTFTGIAIIITLLLAVFISSFPIAVHIRDSLHIHQLSF